MPEQGSMVNGNNAQPILSFSFTLQEWSVIRAGLYELPAKIAVPVIGKLETALMQAQNAQVATEVARGEVIQ